MSAELISINHKSGTRYQRDIQVSSFVEKNLEVYTILAALAITMIARRIILTFSEVKIDSVLDISAKVSEYNEKVDIKSHIIFAGIISYIDISLETKSTLIFTAIK